MIYAFTDYLFLIERPYLCALRPKQEKRTNCAILFTQGNSIPHSKLFPSNSVNDTTHKGTKCRQLTVVALHEQALTEDLGGDSNYSHNI